MLQIKPKYITVDDFKNYWGVDLRAVLRTNDSSSNQAELFLSRVEDRLKNWIDNNTFRRLDYDRLTPFQFENWQKALLTQAMYMFKNGDIGMDSGYDAEKGILVKRSDLTELVVCQATMDYLSNAGLLNFVMKNRPRILKGYPEISIYEGTDGGGHINHQ